MLFSLLMSACNQGLCVAATCASTKIVMERDLEFIRIFFGHADYGVNGLR